MSLPPLFDGCTDEELSLMSTDIAELVSRINTLREKQLTGGGISNDEVNEGVRLIVEIRRQRSGGKGQNELPPAVMEKIGDLF